MFPDVNASNGGGLVPDTEIAEALGMFLLQKSGVAPRYPGRIVEIPDYDATYEYTYKERVYRVQRIYSGSSPDAVRLNRRLPTEIHFDYLRQVAAVPLNVLV